MGAVIGDLLPTALGVAISPVPIIAVILMLLAPRAKAASVGFLVGWVAGIAAVITVVAVLVDPVDDSEGSGPSTVTRVVLLLLGGVACLLAVRSWRSRPRNGQTPELPKWMSAIASSSVPVPVLAHFAAQNRVRKPLDDLRAWLTQNNSTVVAVLLLVIGVTMLGKGLTGLL